jgi:hypothetical protein
MKGTLRYFEPDEETGYKGNWVIQIPTEENNPPKKIDVEFVVICDCHYDEETNTARHALVATIK